MKRDKFLPLGLGQSGQTAILVASHPRSGTHLLIDFLRHNFPQTSVCKVPLAPLDHLYLNIERTTSANRYFDRQRQSAILNSVSCPILKTHYDAKFRISWIERETGSVSAELLSIIDTSAKFYIYRDPAKVMASHFALVRDLPGFTTAKTVLEFALEPHWTGHESRLEWWADHVEGWLSVHDVVSLRYEHVVNAPSETVRRLEDALQLAARRNHSPLPPNSKSVAYGRLSRLLPGRPASTAIVPRRSGPPVQLDLSTLLSKSPGRVSALCRQLGYS